MPRNESLREVSGLLDTELAAAIEIGPWRNEGAISASHRAGGVWYVVGDNFQKEADPISQVQWESELKQ